MKKLAFFAALALLFLSACGGKTGMPTAVPDSAIETQSPTETPRPTETPIPTDAPTPTPIPSDREVKEILRDIILTYAFEERGSERIEPLLSELRSVDPAKADYMDEVMAYWQYVDNDLGLYYNELPPGLARDDTLAIVVLGYQLKPDGTMRDELLGRLQVAMLCASEYPNALVVCAGGGTASKNPSVTEAGEMAKWLIAAGLEPSRLLVENRSGSTLENAKNTAYLLQEYCPQVRTVAIVSSSYHIARASLLFESVFLDPETGADLSVVANGAYDTYNVSDEDSRRDIAGCMMELLVDEETAQAVFYGRLPAEDENGGKTDDGL